MSDASDSRSWFSYRYAVPGFVFVIVFLIENAEPLIHHVGPVSMNTGVELGIALLTFLASPSLGFLIAQAWYCIFEIVRKRSWDHEWRAELLSRKLHDDKSFVTEADYLFYHDNTFLTPVLRHHLTRRWDLFHTLACTILSFGLAYLFGTVFRFFVFGWRLNPGEILCLSLPWSRVHLTILGASLLSVAACWLGALRMRREYSALLLKIARVRFPTVKEQLEQLRASPSKSP
jgi:hypothetical protein